MGSAWNSVRGSDEVNGLISDEQSPEVSAPRPPVSRRFGASEWALVAILAAINFTHILDFVIIMPLGDQLRRQLSINPQQFGFVVSAYGITAMIAGIAASAVVDRFDRKRVLLVAFAGFIVATLYCGLANNYLNLVFARALAGLFGGLTAASVMAIIADVFPPEQRGKAIGAVTSTFALASTIGLPAGLTLADIFQDFAAAFLAIAALAVPVWLFTLWRLRSLTGHRTAVRANPIAQFAAVVRQPNHLISFAFMLAMVMGTFLIVPYMAPYLQANCGRTADDLPIIYAVAGLASLVTMNVFGLMTDRFGPRPVFLFTAGGAVLMTLVVTNLPTVGLWGATAALGSFMVLASGRVVPAQAMMLASADPELRGAFTNLTTAVSHLATGTGPLITGAIVGEAYPGGPLTHYNTAGMVAVVFGITALGLSFLLRPARIQRLESEPLVSRNSSDPSTPDTVRSATDTITS
jgi:predicted MFS family arabinose efflux permease